MSTTFKVCLTPIRSIGPHPNPVVHSLQIAEIYGFQVVIRKDSYKVGDLVFFLPIDTILNPTLENILFPPDSKIKLNGRRIRQIKIQQFPSQGMIVSENDIRKYLELQGVKSISFEQEKNYLELLDLKKFEPPAPKFSQINSVSKSRKIDEQPLFHTYNGLENIKFYPDLFTPDEIVHVQLKLHGTNARLSKLPTVTNTLWKKLKKLLGLLPEYEVRYGSNNVDITAKTGSYKGFYNEDIYGRAFKDCDAANKVKPNEIIYGEVIGEGIQEGYHYGHKTPHFVLFDVKVFDDVGDWRWLNPQDVRQYAKDRGFHCIPLLYEGNYNKAILDHLVSGKDDYYKEHVKEGIVVKSVSKYNDHFLSSRKRALKFINPEYLDNKNNTDFH